jgi:hypothetical protein
MSPAITLPESLDLSHHLNKRVRAAPPSAMKAMGRLVKDKKNLLSLGGGEQHNETAATQLTARSSPRYVCPGSMSSRGQL